MAKERLRSATFLCFFSDLEAYLALANSSSFIYGCQILEPEIYCSTHAEIELFNAFTWSETK